MFQTVAQCFCPKRFYEIPKKRFFIQCIAMKN